MNGLKPGDTVFRVDMYNPRNKQTLTVKSVGRKWIRFENCACVLAKGYLYGGSFDYYPTEADYQILCQIERRRTEMVCHIGSLAQHLDRLGMDDLEKLYSLYQDLFSKVGMV